MRERKEERKEEEEEEKKKERRREKERRKKEEKRSDKRKERKISPLKSISLSFSAFTNWAERAIMSAVNFILF